MRYSRHLVASGVAAVIICLRCVVALGADSPTAAHKPEVLIVVMGVTTPFATFGLIHRFEQIAGVESVTFNLLHGIADVTLRPGAVVTDDEFRRAVRNASYTPGPIRWKHPAPGISPN